MHIHPVSFFLTNSFFYILILLDCHLECSRVEALSILTLWWLCWLFSSWVSLSISFLLDFVILNLGFCKSILLCLPIGDARGKPEDWKTDKEFQWQWLITLEETADCSRNNLPEFVELFLPYYQNQFSLKHQASDARSSEVWVLWPLF